MTEKAFSGEFEITDVKIARFNCTDSSTADFRWLGNATLTLYPLKQMAFFCKLKSFNQISMYETPFERCGSVNCIKHFGK